MLLFATADSPDPDDLRAYQAAAAKWAVMPMHMFGSHRGAKPTGSMASGTSTWRSRWKLIRCIAAAHGLLGQVADKGEWRKAGRSCRRTLKMCAVSTNLALYQARRDKIPDTARAHRQLAEWCDEAGLKAEATAHWTAVVRLNPAQEEAWKKLGYRKQKGRWTRAGAGGRGTRRG